MSTELEKILLSWPRPFLTDQDLSALMGLDRKTHRYDAVKYALRKNALIHLRRGLYLIDPLFSQKVYDPLEIASVMYGPSYISFETALSYHGWIPEAVYTTTAATAKRSHTFETPKGPLRYWHVPAKGFYLNVERIPTQSSSFLMAEPWKAIADMIYALSKDWSSVEDLSADLRIELETLHTSNKKSLKHLSEYYSNNRVRRVLNRFSEELDEYHDH